MFPFFGFRWKCQFNTAQDSMLEETTQTTEGYESPDDKGQEEGDMTSDGKIFISHSALRNKFWVC
jgi:hypothetical protein